TGTYNNPEGVGQFYFRDCVVTECFDSEGQPVTNDPVLGTAVDTVNTWNNQQGADGKNYILAKIADLDPDMQFRTELYGLRIFIKTADGYGFSGRIDVPQLRDLFFGRGAGGDQTMQIACGTWHQRLYVDQWFVPEKGKSKILDILSADGATELDIKLSVDMFQCDPSCMYSKGNIYCYGRLMATIGPIEDNMPKQIVPGRRLYSPVSFKGLKARQNVSEAILTRDAAEKVSNSSAWWNNTDARVASHDGNNFLLIDMGTTTPLKAPSNGVFAIGSSIEIGYLDSDENFQAFAQQGYMQGSTLQTVTEQLQDYINLDAAAEYRDSSYLKNAGVVQIALTSAEAEAIASSRLCILSDSEVVLKENQGGYYINFERTSCRVSPDQTAQNVNLTGFKFGEPLTAINVLPEFQIDFQSLAVLYNKNADDFEANGTQQNLPTDIVSASVENTSIRALPGQFKMTVMTTAGKPFDAQPTGKAFNNWFRKPMDSMMCFINAQSSNTVIGENPGNPFGLLIPAVSVLFWQNQFITTGEPTWDANIGPILTIYAKLYPGMQGIIDIANEETVKAYATQLKARFSLEVDDPAFMPVVRDMSPATIQMMNDWLDTQIAEQKKVPA
ncbi:hypothetical protein ACFL2V_08405, partial [Pseudomonadota bacterium]